LKACPHLMTNSVSHTVNYDVATFNAKNAADLMELLRSMLASKISGINTCIFLRTAIDCFVDYLRFLFFVRGNPTKVYSHYESP
jgi:hypothetical protein